MNNNSSNSLNSNSGSGSGNNKIFSLENKSLKVLGIALAVILFIFCIIMIYIASAYPKKIVTADMTTEVLLNYIHDCKNNPLEISAKNLPASTAGNEYSLTFWVFINNLDSDFLQDKSYSNLDIITKGKVVEFETNTVNIKAIDTDKEQPIKVYLKNKSNTLQIDMKKESGSTDLLAGKKGCYSYSTSAAPPPGASQKFFPDRLTTIEDQMANIKIEDEFCTVESRRVGNQYFGMIRQIVTSDPTKSERKECKYLTSLDLMNLNDDVRNSIILKDISSSNPDDCYFTKAQSDKKTQLNTLIPAIEEAVKHIETVTNAIGTVIAAAPAAADATAADALAAEINTARIAAIDEEYAAGANENIIKVKEELGKPAPADEDVLALYTAAKTFFGLPPPRPAGAKYTLLKNAIDGAIDTAKTKLSFSDTFIYIDAVDKKESLKPCRAEQFPIQRWNCITLNVHNNIVDLFMDGKLLHTCVYDGNLELNNDPIIIGNRGGFDGYVSNVTWSNKSLGATEIYKIYSQGPRIRLTANDRIKYMFMRKPKDLEAGLEEQESVNQESTGRL